MKSFTSQKRRFLALFSLLFLTGWLGAQSHIHTCTIIPAEPAPASVTAEPNLPYGVQKAVSYKPTGRTQSNNWTPGTTVTVRFMGGSAALRTRVMRYAREWTEHANLKLGVVRTGRADIRIGFTQNGSSWSMVGRSSASANQDRPSMNFGWLTDQTPDYEVRRTVLHEFGHALGLLHEHQNPHGGIPWNEEAVYAHYWRTQGWDRNTTYHNVMATASHDNTQFSAYDHKSIMHYPVPSELTNGDYVVGMNNELSATDKYYIAMLYPGRRGAVTSTQPTTRTAPTRSTGTTSPTTTTTAPKPAARHRVRISNSLGQDQKAEKVELYISDRKYVLLLDRNGRTRQDLQLDLPPGRYQYRVVSNSTYETTQSVLRGGKIYNQKYTRDIPGYGKGMISVGRDMSLVLYGEYDQNSGRLNVYLGEAK